MMKINYSNEDATEMTLVLSLRMSIRPSTEREEN